MAIGTAIIALPLGVVLAAIPRYNPAITIYLGGSNSWDPVNLCYLLAMVFYCLR